MLIFLTTICSISVLATAIMMCLCWRKKNEKNDLLGLEGLVTQKNPDENVNHLPSAVIQTVPEGIVVTLPDDIASDANKRPVVVNNPRRSLPDIPFDGGLRNYGDGIMYEPSGDNSSDLYATVEPYQKSTVKRHTLPNGIESRPSISQHSSLSQADDTFSPYARVKEHPYDKLRETEHPYAQVQPSSSNQDHVDFGSGEGTSGTSGLSRKERVTLQTIGEASTSRSMPLSNQSILVAPDIPAASAVSGGIAASQELPYMTPPVAQINFSGDSQDSSRGYTSISVREPLADIRAQTKLLNRRDLDPHYSTVSDDSDDVYTTIHDPNNSVYNSGSETYAQIQPVAAVLAENNSVGEFIHVPSTEESENDSLPYEHTSQLPNISSYKHVTSTHSRQGSSSSSVGVVGSPKPEKRQANSPLPPPPPSLPPNFDLLNSNTSKPSSCRSLDDMYAKVQKARKINEKELDQRIQKESASHNDHSYETLRKVPLKYHEQETLPEDFKYDRCNNPDSLLNTDPGYETLKHHSLPNSEVDPNYEELQQKTSILHTSTNNNICSSNYGYSVVNKVKNDISDEVKSKHSSSNDSETKDLSSTDEPNYESMTSESFSDPNYALLKSTDSESDPNYESVNHNEPNYESVKYLDVSYDFLENENVINEHSSVSVQYNNTDPDYETIKGENNNCGIFTNSSEQEMNCDEIVQV